MKAIILAAGRGSRLGKITESNPKGLTKLSGKSLIDRQIEVLTKAKVSEIAIVRGYKKEKINYKGIKYFDNDNWNNTNMVMSLYKATEWLENYECIVSYSDIVYTSKAIESLCKGKTEDSISLLYNTNWYELWKKRFDDPLSDAETFKIDDNKFLLEIGQKTNSIKDIEGQYMGLIKFNPEIWRKVKDYLDGMLESEKNNLDMTSLLNSLLKKNVKIHTIPYSDLWLEVDSKSDLDLYERCIKANLFRLE